MPCQHVRFPDGTGAIVCGPRRRQRCHCGKPADLLCDWKTPGKGTGTCDTPICSSCTTKPAPGKDLCKRHAQEFEEWKAKR
jgi:hypothetical protein